MGRRPHLELLSLQNCHFNVYSLPTLKNACCGWIVIGLAVVLLGTVPSSTAQSRHVSEPYFAKLGIGLSDYTGDFPIQSFGHPLDFQEIVRGNGIPFTNSSELGYQHSQNLAVVLGLQVGNYPIAGYAGRGGLEDSYRYTLQLLGRYTFETPDWPLSPYIDGGGNVTFGGLETGYGPSIGGGVNIPFNQSVSFFVESRFNLTLPDDAIDGSSDIGKGPPGSLTRTDDPKGSITGPFDSVNQLLGFGLKINFGGFSENVAPPRSFPTPTSPGEETAVRPETPDSETAQPSERDTSRLAEAVLVPSGAFILGLTDEDPLSLQNAGRKRVTVSSFYIDQYEVTNAEYRNYLSELSPEQRRERLPDSTAWSDARTQASWEAYFRSDYYADYPVVAVTWTEARAYCQAQGGRLPTEAEWEYAARGGHIGRVYPWEGLSTRDEDGNYRANFNPPEGYAEDGYAFTAPVGAFPTNDWGLYNMSGNVAEWTGDAYTPSYDNLSDFNPQHRDEGEERRVVRGGAWNSNATFIGVGMRETQPKEEASADIGFRCVQDAVSLRRQGTNQNTTEGGNTPQQK